MIRPKGNRFEVVVYAGRDPVSGRERRVSRTVRTKAEARRVEKELTGDVAKGTTFGSAGTVGEVLERWRQHRRSGWSAKHVESTTRSFELLDDLTDVRLDRLTPLRIEAHYESLRSSGVGASSIRVAHSALRSTLFDAVRWGLIPGNPAAYVRLPRQPKPSSQAPPPEVVKALLAAADPALGAFLRLSIVSGARRGEVCALRWPAVTKDGLTIRSVIEQTGGSIVERGWPKDREPRIVALDSATFEVLSTHLLGMRTRAMEFGTSLDPKGFVFSNAPDGTEFWTPASVSHRFRRLCEKAGVSLRLHDLRHASATWLLGGNIPVRDVSARLGHASTQMTLDTYGHAIPAHDQAAAEVIAGLLA